MKNYHIVFVIANQLLTCLLLYFIAPQMNGNKFSFLNLK